MNSEQWEQLWREQAEPPASAVNIDRFHEQTKRQPESWERDLDDREWLSIRLLLVSVLFSVPGVFVGVFRWDRWLLLLGYLFSVGWLLRRRLERRRIYGDFGLPMRERLDRIERLLRARFESRLNKVIPFGGVLVFAVMFGDRIGWIGGVVFAAIFFGAMGLSLRAQTRIDKTRLEGALQRIAEARAYLDGDPNQRQQR